MRPASIIDVLNATIPYTDAQAEFGVRRVAARLARMFPAGAAPGGLAEAVLAAAAGHVDRAGSKVDRRDLIPDLAARTPTAALAQMLSVRLPQTDAALHLRARELLGLGCGLLGWFHHRHGVPLTLENLWLFYDIPTMIVLALEPASALPDIYEDLPEKLKSGLQRYLRSLPDFPAESFEVRHDITVRIKRHSVEWHNRVLGEIAEAVPVGLRPSPPRPLDDADPLRRLIAGLTAGSPLQPVAYRPDQAKTAARAIQSVLAPVMTEHGLGKARLTAAYELLAAAAGHADWNTMAARLAPADRAPDELLAFLTVPEILGLLEDRIGLVPGFVREQSDYASWRDRGGRLLHAVLRSLVHLRDHAGLVLTTAGLERSWSSLTAVTALAGLPESTLPLAAKAGLVAYLQDLPMMEPVVDDALAGRDIAAIPGLAANAHGMTVSMLRHLLRTNVALQRDMTAAAALTNPGVFDDVSAAALDDLEWRMRPS